MSCVEELARSNKHVSQEFGFTIFRKIVKARIMDFVQHVIVNLLPNRLHL